MSASKLGIRRWVGASVAAMLVMSMMAVAQLSAWSTADPTRVVIYEGVSNCDDGIVMSQNWDYLTVGDDGSIYNLVLSGGTVTVGDGAAATTIGATSSCYSTVLTKTNTDGELEWQRNWSYTTSEYFFGQGLVVSGSRVLVVGQITSGLTVDLDPTSGTDSRTGIGEDGALVELTTSGAYTGSVTFAAQAGRTFEQGQIMVASDGDVIVNGDFDGVLTLPGGSTVTASAGYRSTVVAKVNVAANTTAWKAVLDGNDGGSGEDGSVGLHLGDLHSSGDVILAGYFDATNLVATSADGTSLPAVVNSNPPSTVTNVFVARIDQAGQFAWITPYDVGPSTGVTPLAMTTLANGDVLVSTNRRGLLRFDATGTRLSATSVDFFSYDMTQTNDGKLRLVGFYSGATDFDPGAGTNVLTGDVDGGAFVLTLNADASFNSVTSIEATGRQRGYYVDAHPDGGFVVNILADAETTNLSNTTYDAVYTPSSGKTHAAFLIHYNSAGTTGTTTTTTTTTTTVAPTVAPSSARYITGNKRVTVRWATVDGAASYVVTTPGGTTKCTTGETSCRISGLRNGKMYTYHVRSVNAAGVTSADSRSVRVIPGFKLRTTTHKVRKSPKLTSIVTTASKGTKSWSVRSGSCRISNGRLIMPTKRGTCRLRLSVAKRGSYPAMSTTVRVTVTR